MKLNKIPFFCVFYAILLGVIFLRFYKVADLFVFGTDEEYQAHLAWTIYHHFHIIWIGVSLALGTANFEGFYLGPGFTYLSAFLFHLSKADPVIWGYFSSLFGVIIAVSIYYIGLKVFNRKVGLIALVWYGFSSLMVFFDRRFWNFTPIPFLSIWIYYTLVKAKKDTRWFIVAAICLTASLHSHLVLMVYLIPFGYLLLKKRRDIKPFTWALMSFSSFILLSPLILFEYFKKGQNIFLPIRLLARMHTGAGGSIHHGFTLLLQSISELFFAEPYDAFIFPLGISFIAFGGVFFLLFFLFKKSHSFSHILLGSISIFYLAMIIMWPGDVHTDYLLGFFPLFALLIGYGTSYLNTKILLAGALIFITFNSYSLLTSKTAYGLNTNKKLVQKVSHYVGEKSFYLDNRTNDLFGGFRYLFKIYGKLPTASTSDNRFGWLYPNEISSIKPQLRVIIGSEDPTQKPIHSIKGEGYNAYIYLYK